MMNELLKPFQIFHDLFEKAKIETVDRTVMTLATVDGSGQPSARMLLLKEFDSGGFVFFTNYLSRKSKELDNQPKAALCFFWATIYVQVRIEGRVFQVSSRESDEYFSTRPRLSQIGAWASKQSEPLMSREMLEKRIQEMEAKFHDQEVPRPECWGGYRLVPSRIEFWYGKENRLHDRHEFTLQNGEWMETLLYP